MALPFICMKFLQLNMKLFCTIVFLGKLSSDVLTALIPSEFGMFVYKDFTSSDTGHQLSGTVSATFSLLVK